MPPRSPTFPSYLERSVIEAIQGGRPIPVRTVTIDKMLTKGWIVRDRESAKFRVTQAGIDAVRKKLPGVK